MREYQRFTRHLIQRYAIVFVTTEDFGTAAQLTQEHPLKAYDTVQLAVALRLGRAVVGHLFTVVSGDATLLSAARAEGLTTETPFDHVAPEESPGRGG